MGCLSSNSVDEVNRQRNSNINSENLQQNGNKSETRKSVQMRSNPEKPVSNKDNYKESIYRNDENKNKNEIIQSKNNFGGSIMFLNEQKNPKKEAVYIDNKQLTNPTPNFKNINNEDKKNNGENNIYGNLNNQNEDTVKKEAVYIDNKQLTNPTPNFENINNEDKKNNGENNIYGNLNNQNEGTVKKEVYNPSDFEIKSDKNINKITDEEFELNNVEKKIEADFKANENKKTPGNEQNQKIQKNFINPEEKREFEPNINNNYDKNIENFNKEDNKNENNENNENKGFDDFEQYKPIKKSLNKDLHDSKNNTLAQQLKKSVKTSKIVIDKHTSIIGDDKKIENNKIIPEANEEQIPTKPCYPVFEEYNKKGYDNENNQQLNSQTPQKDNINSGEIKYENSNTPAEQIQNPINGSKIATDKHTSIIADDKKPENDDINPYTNNFPPIGEDNEYNVNNQIPQIENTNNENNNTPTEQINKPVKDSRIESDKKQENNFINQNTNNFISNGEDNNKESNVNNQQEINQIQQMENIDIDKIKKKNNKKKNKQPTEEIKKPVIEDKILSKSINDLISLRESVINQQYDEKIDKDNTACLKVLKNKNLMPIIFEFLEPKHVKKYKVVEKCNLQLFDNKKKVITIFSTFDDSSIPLLTKIHNINKLVFDNYTKFLPLIKKINAAEITEVELNNDDSVQCNDLSVLPKLNCLKIHCKNFPGIDRIRSLEILNFSNAGFSSINFELFKNINLKELYLNDNNFTDFQFLQQCNFPELSILNLSKNKIKNISFLSRCNFTELSVLDLHGNPISSIQPLQNCTFKSLTVLNLNEVNNEKCLVDLASCDFPILSELYLSENNLKSNNNLSTFDFQKLTVLDLSNNQLENILFFTSFNFPLLEKLYLMNNRIVDIQIFESVNFKQLKELDLGLNDLTNIDILEKCDFKELRKLVLCYNHISNINVIQRWDFPVLKDLDLEGNDISNNENNINTMKKNKLNVKL